FREYARNLIGDFVEVWVKCSLETCIKRDSKGLYKKAIEGTITNFTGVQDPYEPPTNAEVIVDTERESAEESADRIINCLSELGYLTVKDARNI
ncbi:MAG: adenylyl-sulfate kinase, partial [Nitrososphaerales archaeon]